MCMCLFNSTFVRLYLHVTVSQLDHTDNDCLCVITLTHGLEKGIICANDVMYTSNELWKPFTADKCLTLAGKPKLFFIQVNQLKLNVFESCSTFKLSTYSDMFPLCHYYITFCLGL